jgi:hypothetical protein
MPSRKRLPGHVVDVLDSYRGLAVGATNPVSSEFPTFFDSFSPRPIRPREARYYEYLGYTVTRPDHSSVVFGLSYKERNGGKYKEDLFVVNLDRGELLQHARGAFEEVDPRYKGTHHGDKSYLDS